MNGPKILVDTDVIIDFLRKKTKALQLLENAIQSSDLYISVITLAEILAGMRPSEKTATEDLIASFNLISVHEAIARRAGMLRNQSKSRQIQLPDCLIAASALEEGCDLLTFNQKDYPFVGLNLIATS